MPWSNDVLTRTVTGSYLSANGDPAVGKLSFRPTSRILDKDDTIVLNTAGMIVELDDNGEFSIELPTTDNPILKPRDWAYEVTVKLYGAAKVKFYMLLPYGDGTVANIVNVLGAGSSTDSAVGFTSGQTGLRGPIGPPGDWSSAKTISTKIASYALTTADAGKLIVFNSSSSVNLTVPKNSAAAFNVGQTVDVAQYGTGQVTVVPVDGDVTLRYTPTAKTRAQYSHISLVKIATDEWLVYGDLALS